MHWDNTAEENFVSVCNFLEIYGKAFLVINGDKFQFCQDTVDFAGMEVTSKGVRLSRKFLDTIAELPSPTNTKEVRAFHGLVNQVKVTQHRPAASRGEWCVERAVSTSSSCSQVCAVEAEEGLRAVTFERVKRAMDEDEEMVDILI